MPEGEHERQTDRQTESVEIRRSMPGLRVKQEPGEERQAGPGSEQNRGLMEGGQMWAGAGPWREQ